MDEYLRDQRRAFDVGFVPPIVGGETFHTISRGGEYSPSSTLSSVNSQDLDDFVSDFRQAYFSLRPRKGNGFLTKEELGEVLFLLDQEPSEDELTEMFHDVDREGKGFIELEVFLNTAHRRLLTDSRGVSTPASRVSPPNSASTAYRRMVVNPPSSEFAAAAETAATCARASVSSSSNACTAPSGTTPPHSSQDVRPGSNASANGKVRRDSANVKVSSSSSRKTSSSGSRSQPMVLWWGFQDLADTL